jgi:hypothetical protein
VKQATAAGRDVLIVVGSGAEEVAEFVVASTEGNCSTPSCLGTVEGTA